MPPPSTLPSHPHLPLCPCQFYSSLRGWERTVGTAPQNGDWWIGAREGEVENKKAEGQDTNNKKWLRTIAVVMAIFVPTEAACHPSTGSSEGEKGGSVIGGKGGGGVITPPRRFQERPDRQRCYCYPHHSLTPLYSFETLISGEKWLCRRWSG